LEKPSRPSTSLQALVNVAPHGHHVEHALCEKLICSVSQKGE
jgi:hypothetical protein